MDPATHSARNAPHHADASAPEGSNYTVAFTIQNVSDDCALMSGPEARAVRRR